MTEPLCELRFTNWLNIVTDVTARVSYVFIIFHSFSFILKMSNLSDEQKIELIKKNIGSFPDFPKEGILFR